MQASAVAVIMKSLFCIKKKIIIITSKDGMGRLLLSLHLEMLFSASASGLCNVWT